MNVRKWIGRGFQFPRTWDRTNSNIELTWLRITLNHCGQKKVSKFVALVYLVFYATPLQNMETEVDTYFFEQSSSSIPCVFHSIRQFIRNQRPQKNNKNNNRIIKR